MKKSTLFTAVLIISISLCFGAKKNKPPIKKGLFPPGTVWLKDSLFMDATEVKNLDYLEYLYWINRVFGKDSIKAALPDTLVWFREYYKDADLTHQYPEVKDTTLLLIKILSKYIGLSSKNNITINSKAFMKHDPGAYYSIYYFRDPKYRMYPVVGLSYEQAVNYCKWRTDRVAEYILIREKILKWDISQNKDNYFTIESFMSGKYKCKEKEYNPKQLPKNLVFHYFRLPTKEEWEYAATVGYEKPLSDSIKLSNKFESKPNKLGIYNILSNVSEMITEKGIAKDDIFSIAPYKDIIKKDIPYTKPTCWLGFRCVAKIKKLK
jgi:hypothetical protein